MSFLSDAQIVISALEKYHQECISRQKPVIHQPPLEALASNLELSTYMRKGGLSGERLAQFLTQYLESTTRLLHPAYLAHQVGTSHYAGALASLIDGFTHNPMAIYEMGPGAATIEWTLINWLLTKVGWQPQPLRASQNADRIFGGGVLTHGGSLANLTALLAARSRVAPDAWQEGNPGNLVILAPAESHYSIARAAGIMGLGRNAVHSMAVDDRGVVIPEKLPETYARLTDEGKTVMAVVANGCSTAAGLYDPIRKMGEFCNAQQVWLHIDGAHGASALLSDRHKKRLDGVELADSLIWDAHKLLRTPSLCTAVLVKDARTIDQAFQQEASYIFHEKDQPGFDFIHRTVECTKAGLGLKWFFVLAALGEQGLAKHVDDQYERAQLAYDFIEAQPEFSCAAEPQSNILCFRVDASDALQLEIRDKLIAQGDFYLSTTEFGGRRYLRMVFNHPDTSLDDIKRLIQEIRKLVH
ncbi:MAG: pyridoxal-dependent decarboxylase [Desulfobacterales bacterium]|nr:pyridoxal-dependent decarboxylase [Desulfobacterales bacterium]